MTRARVLLTVYHKPSCTKCRRLRALLKRRRVPYAAVDYFRRRLTPGRLRSLLTVLRLKPRALLRTKEPLYRRLGLRRRGIGDGRLISLMCRHPQLIKRPLVLAGRRGVVARPAERALRLLRARRSVGR